MEKPDARAVVYNYMNVEADMQILGVKESLEMWSLFIAQANTSITIACTKDVQKFHRKKFFEHCFNLNDCTDTGILKQIWIKEINYNSVVIHVET